MLRILLYVLSLPLAVLILVSGYQWYRAATARPVPFDAVGPTRPDAVHRRQAEQAIEAFSELGPDERRSVVANLEANLIATSRWVDSLIRSDYRLICLGEDHEESTRWFLADEFFASFPADVVLLEATPEDLVRIRERMAGGTPYAPLLDADIARVLRAAVIANPDVEVTGIEETKAQRLSRQHHDRRRSRDHSILENLWTRYRPGRRHVILFGALHCSNRRHWLFDGIRQENPATIDGKLVNVRVLGAHQDGPLEAFLGFLEAVGVHRDHFAVPDTARLHPRIREWFPLMSHGTSQYRALLVYRI